jgi:putative chitinase
MIDTIKLLELHAAAFPPALDPIAALNLRLLAGELDADPAMSDLRWRAYALATVRRECGPDYQIRTERGAPAQFEHYEMRQDLGNTQPGDGFRFRGRGFVQITGRRNYEKFSPLVGVDLVAEPDTALRPDIAYRILSIGMTRGLFTGRALHHFIGATCDYREARRIINGLDYADEIAASAVRLQEILEACAMVPTT